MTFFALCLLTLLDCISANAQPKTGARPPKTNVAPPVDPAEWTRAGVKGKLDFYVSKMDGQRRPYAICSTSDSPAKKPLLVVLRPGAFKKSPEAGAYEISTAEQHAWYAKKKGQECIALYALGRGPGSVYQNYGEVDVLEAIEDVVKKYPVDRDRISVTGVSMGGAGAWFLASHYPDMFAAATPMAAYCDYRLWEVPGGLMFQLQPWEVPSWEARSAVFLTGNLAHTPVWIAHGEWDRGSDSGVPVAQARQMFRLLKEKAFDVQYTEIPKLAHSVPPEEVMGQVISWQLQQKKQRHPSHVSFTTWWLRHNRSYWVAIDQIEHYGRRSSIDATETAGQVVVQTENLRAFSIGPIAGAQPRTVRVDGQPFPDLDVSKVCSFSRGGSAWKTGGADVSREKHHGSSGPISDIFFDNVILVPGTVGAEVDTHFNWLTLNLARRQFKNDNGGLNRGGEHGSNSIDLPYLEDVKLTEDEIRNNNLLLYGNTRNNAILKRYQGRLPLAFDAKSIRLGDRTYSGDKVSVFAVFPHPDNPDRYIAVHGGVTADAINWGNYLNLQLLPDYIVYDGGKLLDWGFFDNAWKHPEGL